jgi:lysylphosphatidylglycerol synthetase-like protein (DUF2156 family)
MQFWYRLLADLTVVVHAAYVLFVIFGLLAVLAGYLRGWAWIRNFWFRLIHLAMILIVVGESLCGIPCPLTVWEQRWRRLAGQEGYHGDFVASFVHDMLFFDFEPWVFTVCYTLFGMLVLATFFLAPPRWPRRSAVDANSR